MIPQQTKFTETEALAICEMLGKLAVDDYSIHICPDRREIDNVIYATFEITILDTDGSIIALEGASYLIDALAMAYTATPEHKKDIRCDIIGMVPIAK